MTTGQKAPVDIARQAGMSERIFSIIFVAGCFTVGITILDRILGGGWRSFGSMLSSFLLAAYALIPVLGVGDLSEREQRSWTTGVIAGGIAGLVYGLIFRSILPGVFFGACVGGGSVSLCERLLGKGALRKQLGAVAVGLFAAHFLGLLPPTKLIRSGKSETANARQSISSKHNSLVRQSKGLQIVQSLNELDDVDCERYSEMASGFERDGKTFVGTTSENMLLLLMVPSAKWKAVAKKKGLTRQEYFYATNLIFMGLGDGYNPQNRAMHDERLVKMTGERLAEY